MFRLFLFLCTSLIFSGCHSSTKNENKYSYAKLVHATGFSIAYGNNHTVLTVNNPWDSSQVLHKYVLVEANKPLPKNLPEGDVVRIPVQSIACLSSAEAAMIQELGDIDKVRAIAEAKYIKMPILKKGLETGKVADIGDFSAINIEQLMQVNPDIIIVAPYQNMGYGKIETLGISIVECASYTENSPLGRAEWIRFIAAFLQKDQEAEAWINEISERYQALLSKTDTLSYKPTVFSEKMYNSVWYVPGGNSYVAHLFKDAGAKYLWEEDKSTGSLSLTFETVYDKAEKAEFWIIKSDRDLTYQTLQDENHKYLWFDAWKNRNILFSNTFTSNYYEEGLLRPDLVLADLIELFHPQLSGTTDSLRYFKRMTE